jgi:hypothetical protein
MSFMFLTKRANRLVSIKTQPAQPPSGRIAHPIPRHAGKVPLHAGKVPLLAGEVPLLAGEVPLLAGEVPLLAGEVPLLAGKVPLLAGKLPLLAGKLPPHVAEPSRDWGGTLRCFGVYGLVWGWDLIREVGNLLKAVH